MPRYRYEAVDAAGETLRDELEAPTPDAAVEQLRDRGLLPLSVNEAKGGLFRGGLGQPLFSNAGHYLVKLSVYSPNNWLAC